MAVQTADDPIVFDVDSIRRDFPIFDKPLAKGRRLVYLDSASSAQKPRQVIDLEQEVLESYYANAYRGVYQFGARISEEIEDTRETVCRFVGASEPAEIVLTSGTTMSINLVAQAWGRKFLHRGDEILLNETEHHANLVPWQQLAVQTGANLRFLPLTEDCRLDLQRLGDVLSNRTRLIAITAMSNVLGTVNSIAKIAAAARSCGALTLVDAAQFAPHFPIDVNRLGVDFLAFSGHKLYGPTGVGVLFARRELQEAMDPFLCGGHMISEVFQEHSTWADPPAKFEAGTIPIVQAIALKAAIEYVTGLGFECIDAHEREILRDAHQRLCEIPGLTIYGPGIEHKAAIVSFTIDGIAAEDLALLLDRRGVFVRHGHHCTMPLHKRLGVPATVRASFGLYNSVDDVEALVDAIQFAREKLRLT